MNTLTHTNPKWTHIDVNARTFTADISEVNFMPSKPLLDPWDRPLYTGDLTARRDGENEITHWDMTTLDPNGNNAKLIIYND